MTAAETMPGTTKIEARPGGERVTRLGTPSALLMLGGLALVYFALHGFDAKHGTFSGLFAGIGNIPATKLASATSTPVVPSATLAVASSTNDSAAIATLQRYITNLQAVPHPTTRQQAELTLYQARLAQYQSRGAVTT